jgi:hypothetical protein
MPTSNTGAVRQAVADAARPRRYIVADNEHVASSAGVQLKDAPLTTVADAEAGAARRAAGNGSNIHDGDDASDSEDEASDEESDDSESDFDGDENQDTLEMSLDVGFVLRGGVIQKL